MITKKKKKKEGENKKKRKHKETANYKKILTEKRNAPPSRHPLPDPPLHDDARRYYENPFHFSALPRSHSDYRDHVDLYAPYPFLPEK